MKAMRVLVVAACVLMVLSGAQAAEKMKSAAIVYGLNRVEPDAWQRIVDAPEITYVCFQLIMPEGPLPALVRERCAELVAKGKRPIVQIWWGPTWPYPWAKYGYANISLDAVSYTHLRAHET